MFHPKQSRILNLWNLSQYLIIPYILTHPSDYFTHNCSQAKIGIKDGDIWLSELLRYFTTFEGSQGSVGELVEVHRRFLMSLSSSMTFKTLNDVDL